MAAIVNDIVEIVDKCHSRDSHEHRCAAGSRSYGAEIRKDGAVEDRAAKVGDHPRF